MTLINTEILSVHPLHPQPDIIARAATWIKNGALVAFPTETVYGLGGNALDANAVQRIFLSKGRPAFDPLIVHIAGIEWIDRVVAAAPPKTELLTREFWPGALTLICQRRANIPLAVTAGGEKVAVRAPIHPVAQALIRAADTPIAAPSANRFGHTSPTQASHVWDDLAGKVELILDGGKCPIGLESTVLDLTTDPPVILRPGGVTREQIERVIGSVHLLSQMGNRQQIVSPGMLERHYSPAARLILVSAVTREAAVDGIRALISQFSSQGLKTGVLTVDEEIRNYSDLDVEIITLGSLYNLDQIAKNLFAGMRTLEQAGIEVILSTDYGQKEIGLAIHDRLHRAASQVIHVV